MTREEIGALHHAMRATPGAANRVLALISKMMNLAERWGLRPMGSNPCRPIERYPGQRLERFLAREEIERLGETLRELERAQLEVGPVIAAIRFLLLTGVRRNEALHLRWEDVDFERALLRLFQLAEPNAGAAENPNARGCSLPEEAQATRGGGVRGNLAPAIVGYAGPAGPLPG